MFKLRKSHYILLFMAIIFFVAYVWFIWPQNAGLGLQPRFDWPDETANYFWINHLVQTNQLTLSQPLNLIAQNQIHPRSSNVLDNGSLVPGSFLGLILFYGVLAKIIGLKLIFLLPPLFSVLAVLAFFGIVKKIFDERVALISACLMFMHPVWWYYSSIAWLPNIIFVAFIIFSLYFLLAKEKISWPAIILSGSFLGLALSFRPTEIVWLSILYLAVLVYIFKKLSWQKILVFVILSGSVILPSLYFQFKIFGSIFTSGYSQLQSQANSNCLTCQIIQAILLPFGFDLKNILKNVWHYLVFNFWWLNILALLGWRQLMVQKNQIQREKVGYLVLGGVISLWLVIYYGSWQFSDLMTVNLNFLAISYLRYWLPIYIFSLPLVALGLVWLAEAASQKFKNFLIIIFLLIIFVISADLVIWLKPDSLQPVKARIGTYYQIARQVNEKTEASAIIITSRKDKVFFPERQVIQTFDALSQNQELQNKILPLLAYAPAYYYALANEPVWLGNEILSLEEVLNINGEVLYKINRQGNE